MALDLIETYRNDAIMNGLSFDIHREEEAVELFAENILEAGVQFLERSSEAPFIPTWNRVFSAMPDIFDELVAAVETDHEEFSAARELPKVARG
jgi:glucosyl-3-phosphoglycerate synthase